MPGDPRVRQLLEEILDSGSSPEQVCRACPELLPEPVSTRDPAATPPVRPNAELPRVPGYVVQAVLGRGGMGVVFKAWQVRLHRPVALKMLLAGACATPAERE